MVNKRTKTQQINKFLIILRNCHCRIFLYVMNSFIPDLYGECNVPNWSGCYREGGDIPPIASGKIRTREKFSMRYGRVEIRAKMPVGDWTWPGNKIIF